MNSRETIQVLLRMRRAGSPRVWASEESGGSPSGVWALVGEADGRVASSVRTSPELRGAAECVNVVRLKKFKDLPASEEGLCRSESGSRWIERMDSGLAGSLGPDCI